MKRDRCPKNPSTGVTAGRHNYVPTERPPYTDSGACAEWACDYCGKRIRYDDTYAVAPRARGRLA